MSKIKRDTLAQTQADRLTSACRKLGAGHAGSRELAVVGGILANGQVEGHYDAKLAQITDRLVDTGKFYLKDGYDVVYERADGALGLIITLATASSVEAMAGPIIANHIVAQTKAGDKGDLPHQFPLPGAIVSNLLHRGPTREALPKIRQYVRRPLMGRDYVLRGPGYHADVQAMVHSFDLEVPRFERSRETLPVIDRLPPHLRRLLADFCFRTPADIVNAVGMLLTGLLAEHFVEPGKPVFIFDGNQPNLGKTLLALGTGVILDGELPTLNRYVANEVELEKQIGASLCSGAQSILVIDNAKTRDSEAISSPTVESMSVSPKLSGRILGKTENYQRDNTLLWVLTMNDTRVSRDLASRSVPVQFFYEGDGSQRDFQGRSPVEYARQHRAEIMGELVGTVYYWTSVGRPTGTKRHRLAKWAEVVGGILQSCGFPEFLENQQAAEAEFDAAFDQLRALAEIVAASNVLWVDIGQLAGASPDQIRRVARQPANWVTVVQAAGLLQENSRSGHGTSSRVGTVLSPFVGRTVDFEVRGRSGRATLRSIVGAGRKKLYFLEVAWLASTGDCPPTPPPEPAAENDSWLPASSQQI